METKLSLPAISRPGAMVVSNWFSLSGGTVEAIIKKGYQMANHDQSGGSHSHAGGFWKSRSGLALLAFLAVAGFLLAYEHRVHVLTTDGILIGLFALCIGFHFFMHGGHGGDDDSGGGRGEKTKPPPRHEDATMSGDRA